MRAKRSMKRSDGARLPCASSTSAATRESVESPRRASHADGQRALGVQRAGEQLVAGLLVHRHRLAGDRRLIDARGARSDDAVERDPLARAGRRHRAPTVTSSTSTSCSSPSVDDARLGGRELHQRRDRAAAALERHRLQAGADREQHEHPRALGVRADADRADGGQRHQHVHVQRAGGAARPTAARAIGQPPTRHRQQVQRLGDHPRRRRQRRDDRDEQQHRPRPSSTARGRRAARTAPAAVGARRTAGRAR